MDKQTDGPTTRCPLADFSGRGHKNEVPNLWQEVTLASDSHDLGEDGVMWPIMWPTCDRSWMHESFLVTLAGDSHDLRGDGVMWPIMWPTCDRSW